MSRLTKKNYTKEINFMNGNSYKLSALETLKMIACSSIFGEPSYYRDTNIKKDTVHLNFDMSKYTLFNTEDTTDKIFINATNKALQNDYIGTLNFAVELRNEYNMKLNPAVIFVLAINHEKRIEINKEFPGFITEIAKKIINIPSDITNMFEFYIHKNETKNNMPSCLKRIFAKNLETFSKYHIAKYKSKSLIDIVRISHANSEPINELMKTGTIKIEENNSTWEKLKSSGKTWNEIINTIHIPHMALLRNLRGIFNSENCSLNYKEAEELLTQLEKGVEKGRQFPFSYYTAYKVIENSSVMFKKEILNSLETCIDIAMENFPMLKGTTVCLADNSGSAHGACTSEYGSVKVSDIANLSSVMTAYNSEKGFVGTFGDNLKTSEIVKEKRIFEQHKNLDTNVGQSTENGIWIFFRDAIKNNQFVDNIFIYSDQQAGHGGLYGKNENEYREFQISSSRKKYIDVLKLVSEYRKKVNPKVNIFSIQVAGYSNSVIPENIYRGAVLYGWTGKETVFASKIINFWNEKENIS